MKDLQTRIEKMLEGEKKRREVALRFVEELEEILMPITELLWGHEAEYDKKNDPEYTCVSIWRVNKNGQKITTDLYFRFEGWQGIDDAEEAGFYLLPDYRCDITVWGDKLENIKGKDFWYCIQLLIEWIPQLSELIDKENESRDRLTGLITHK